MLGNTPVTFGFVTFLEVAPATAITVWRRRELSLCSHLDCAAMKARSKLHSLLARVLLLRCFSVIEIPEFRLNVLKMWVSEEGADSVEQTLLAVS